MRAEECHVLIELKYCERCGELWFREAGSNACLCGRCTSEEPRVAQRYETRRIEGCAKWFGPMSCTVERLQGVAAESGRPA